MPYTLTIFFEELLLAPRFYHYPIIILLLPLSIIYATLMLIRRVMVKKVKFDLPIVSIGNLIVGGSGKTPFLITIASQYNNVFIISRGYGRQSRGLIEVSHYGKILVDVLQSGDEAMLMAQSLPNASLIVSENRSLAIEYAQQLGANVIFLDDGFNRVEIEKFDILLEPKKIANYLPLPSGAFREFYFSRYFANMILKEDHHFKRIVSFENLSDSMLLVTAIANPKRLAPYLPHGVKAHLFFADHDYFDSDKIEQRMQEVGAQSILVTQKDFVKLQDTNLSISLMKLRLDIESDVFEKIDEYIKTFEK